MMAGNMARCPICSSDGLKYEFSIDGIPLYECKDCSLLFLNQSPVSPLERLIDTRHGAAQDAVQSKNAKYYLELLVENSSVTRGNMLLISDEQTGIAQEAEKMGFRVRNATAGDVCSGLPKGEMLQEQEYDLCVLFCALEKAPDPGLLLERSRQMLKTDGCLMIVCISLDSLAARVFKGHWWEFRRENLYYFNINTLQNLLAKSGFCKTLFQRDFRNVSINYAKERAKHLKRPLLGKILTLASRIFPNSARHQPFRFFDSRVIVFSHAAARLMKPKLSVIVPAFNEMSTFSRMMDLLLSKSIAGVEVEVIIVESNSTDGTREEALRYEGHPRVKLILEDKPRGKGHAVRTGLSNATGDVILIQDADLEYDINDYDALLEPILGYQQSFVIGSRHIREKQSWKMREFNDDPVLAAVYNLGHLFFLHLLNFTYRQSMFDPFSMFKVFRKDCLFGLTFECNRFDFDFELVIKLLRKGYRPLELSVNYCARSPKEGKKVNLFRDPFTYLRAIIKYRFTKLYEKRR